jgi:uncharacterized membrane protein
MDWMNIHAIQIIIQHTVSTIGIVIILIGALQGVLNYFSYFLRKSKNTITINTIRLKLGQTLVLGLEFIVAADLIGSTTTPDYYSVGILAIIVLIRTFLSFTLNREILSLSKAELGK